jgi:DNA-binding transcriptional regulator GbsR (MarR family)
MSRSLGQLYGTLFLDCPPGISLLSENVLRAASAVGQVYAALWAEVEARMGPE